MEQKNDVQYRKMTQTTVSRLVLTMAVPTMIAMLVTAVYNMVDTYFVSKLGTSASGAVGILFSMMALIQAVGFTIGMGAGAQISRLLGRKETDMANEVASSAVISGFILGGIIAVLGVCFTEPIIRMLGATETILPYAKEYGRYIFLAAPVMITCFILNNLLRAEGRAKYSMFGIISGGLLNIALDPLFLFVFHMGLSGAAIATAISQCVAMLFLFLPYIRKKTVLCLSFKHISRSANVYGRIIKFGTPSLFRQGFASVASVLLNRSAAGHGDSAVAAMSIVAKVFMVLFSVLIGFGQGYQPVAGYNYGAKMYSRVREAFWFTLKTATVGMVVFALAAYFFSSDLVSVFLRNDEQVIKIGTQALRMQSIAMPFMALGVVCNMTFQAIGRSVAATFLTSMRQGIFFVPLILILPKFYGLIGLEAAQPAADLITFLFCIPYAVIFLKDMKKAKNDPQTKV